MTPSQAAVGAVIKFTIVVNNTTNAPVTITRIIDTLPQGFVVESCTSDHGGSCATPPSGPGQVEWPVDVGGYTVTLNAGESMHLAISGVFPTVPPNNQACNRDYAVSWTGGRDISGKEACITIQPR